MKSACLFGFLILVVSGLSGQERSLSVGIQSGYYKANNYPNIQPGRNISIEFSCLSNERFLISSNVTYGHNRYYESQKSNCPDIFLDQDGTNTDQSTIHISLMVGYRLDFLNILFISGQAGLGTYTQTARYPWQPNESTWGYAQYSWTDLAFPVKVCFGMAPLKHLEIALVGGFYVEPDFPLVGFHFGPQLNVTF